MRRRSGYKSTMYSTVPCNAVLRLRLTAYWMAEKVHGCAELLNLARYVTQARKSNQMLYFINNNAYPKFIWREKFVLSYQLFASSYFYRERKYKLLSACILFSRNNRHHLKYQGESPTKYAKRSSPAFQRKWQAGLAYTRPFKLTVKNINTFPSSCRSINPVITESLNVGLLFQQSVQKSYRLFHIILLLMYNVQMIESPQICCVGSLELIFRSSAVQLWAMRCV